MTVRISQRLDYTVRLLISLAARPPGTVVPTGELARRLSMPTRFLEQQMTLLAKTGLVSCRRGTGGGCSLARSADEITVAQIINAVQGDIIDVPRTSGSAAAELWQNARASFEQHLAGVTLGDLARRQSEIDSAAEAMYCI